MEIMWVGTPAGESSLPASTCAKTSIVLTMGIFLNFFSSQCIRNWPSSPIRYICKEVGTSFPLLPFPLPFTRFLTHKSQFVSPAVWDPELLLKSTDPKTNFKDSHIVKLHLRFLPRYATVRHCRILKYAYITCHSRAIGTYFLLVV